MRSYSATLGTTISSGLVAIAVVVACLLTSCGSEEKGEVVPTSLDDLQNRDFAGHHEKGCLTAGCHQQLSKQRWIHAPTAVQACALCHEQVPAGGGEEHQFQASVPTREMCLRCHEANRADEFIHEPYGSANCIACHDPHGGSRKNFLVTDRVEELCISCHKSTPVAVPHEPHANGDCLSCHESHSSRHEHLLLRREVELCTACHREFRGFLAENIVEAGLVNDVHPAVVTEGCLACHQAHGSERKAMMRDELRTNCQRCHADLAEGIEDAAVVHGAFNKDESCVLCHTPHASVFDGLLAAAPSEVCFQCHDKDVEMASGRVLGSVQEKIAKAKVVHHPVAEGDCTVCHIAHFSPGRSLLRMKYPHKIYSEFSGGSYELCFQCHDKLLAEEAGSSFTAFRNGDTNLHFAHVNREKGRACDICHDPHAADGYRLVRDYYPFGPSRWPMPLGFVPTPTGGTCTTACHEEKTYTR